MKRLTMVFMMIALVAQSSYAAPNKSFKLGLPYSTAQVLLAEKQVGGRTFTPTLGISYFGINSEFSRSDEYESEDFDMSAHFIIPRLGARFLGEKIADLNSYYFGEAFLVIPLIDGSDLDSEDKKEIKDATDVFGMTLGSGVEHYFSDSFSIGGELSFNMLFHSTSTDNDSDYQQEMKTRVGATLTQITFNYYFQ